MWCRSRPELWRKTFFQNFIHCADFLRYFFPVMLGNSLFILLPESNQHMQSACRWRHCVVDWSNLAQVKHSHLHTQKHGHVLHRTHDIIVPLYVVELHLAPCHTFSRSSGPEFYAACLLQRKRPCIASRRAGTAAHNRDDFLLGQCHGWVCSVHVLLELYCFLQPRQIFTIAHACVISTRHIFTPHSKTGSISIIIHDPIISFIFLFPE